MGKWLRVNRTTVCPICQKPDWCMISADGKSAFCMRIANDNIQPNGGWVHKLDESVKPQILPKKQKKVKKYTERQWLRYIQKCSGSDLTPLSKELGISIASLDSLCVGYNGKRGFWTFPMFDGHGKVIGIRTRIGSNKRSVAGSSNGLFIPDGLPAPDLAIVEGPTDTGTMLDLDIFAIGRASCNCCVDHIRLYVKRAKPKNIVIIADNDEAKVRPDGVKYYPGQDGAIALAKALPYKDLPIKIIKPIGCKDARVWKQKGLTKKLFLSIVKNTRRFI